MSTLLLAIAACVVVRLISLIRLWRLPEKRGPGLFLAVPVDAEFPATDGRRLLHDYHRAQLSSATIEIALALAVWRIGGAHWLLIEQSVALVLGEMTGLLVRAHFTMRAGQSVHVAGERVAVLARTATLRARVLKDETDPRVEGALIAGMVATITLLVVGRRPSAAFFAVWLVYVQIGLVLLKGVFVRQVPVDDPEVDASASVWRRAWLDYHLHTTDAARAFLVLLIALPGDVFAPGWPQTVNVLALLVLTRYGRSERQRFRQRTNGIAPATPLVRLLARRMPEGRYLAGGRLFVNKDYPGILVRSPSGLSLNVANPVFYGWTAYLAGLIVLITIQKH